MTTESAIIQLPYTQESHFEQAINNEVAELWHKRNEGFIKSADKRKLFWISLTAEHHSKAIVVVNGRIECTYKYQELFFDLFQQGYNIYAYDHRGQGLSERLIDNPEMGYVGEFDDYVSDLALLVEFFDLSRYQKRFLLGHSMGGNIITRYIQTHSDHPFNAMTVTAPMYGMNIAWYLKPVAMLLSQVLTALRSEPSYAPGQGPYYPKPFEGNLLSQSSVRYHWFRQLYDAKPELKIGGASTRWVWQGLMASKQCLLLTRQIKLPFLLIQAGDDQIVSNAAQIRFIKKLARTNPQCALKIVYHARHELLFEIDEYRNQTLQSTLDFFAQH
ncbi:lysophospholipase L2 [Vibrio ichthyoenteri ATCC 700023]|uniref:Lysophospholipase L2 n=1 Tax=Vibrio ichthyoenteri ATCC 700023 TaxID=870968 RepID=F9S521_9VIBR|nr:alpha/beta fold hydrolase [Vibrio ichthyoenteri]EGU36195.1 lysophospholipase L2 [Vibrio ichthyoenteri ATCC 700023]